MQMNCHHWVLANFKRCTDNILGILFFIVFSYFGFVYLCLYEI